MFRAIFLLGFFIATPFISSAQTFPKAEGYRQIIDSSYSELKNRDLKIAVYSSYDLCENNNEYFGKANIFKDMLKSVFEIDSKLLRYSSSKESEQALINGDVDMVFGLRKSAINDNSSITFSSPLFSRDLYIVSSDAKNINMRNSNVSSLDGSVVLVFPNTNISSVFNIFLNMVVDVEEVNDAKTLVNLLTINNKKDYAVIPADTLQDIQKLTNNLVKARFITDTTGRIAIKDKNLEPILDLINKYIEDIGLVAFEEIENYNNAELKTCLFMTTSNLSEAEKDFIKNTKKIKVYLHEIRYPIVFINDKNEVNGMYIEEMKAFSEIIGIPLEFIVADDINVLERMQNSMDMDTVFLNYIRLRRHPHDNVSVINNYFFDWLVVYARKIKSENWQYSKKVGVVNSSPAHRYLLQIGKNDINTYEFGIELFDALRSGELDYAIAVNLSYKEQIFRDDYWMVKIASLPVFLTLDTFTYHKDSPIGELFKRAMNVYIDYHQITSRWLDNSDMLIGTFLTKYYYDLSAKKRSQVISSAAIIVLICIAVSMSLLLLARTTTNKALQLATKSAKEASAAKSMFLSNMSHEIRTPLNAILGLAQIAKYAKNQSKAFEIVSQIETAGNHLLALINDILDMSKIESANFTISSSVFNVHKSIKNINNMIAIRANEKLINFQTNVDENMPKYLLGDSLRLDQILLNLLSNAIKFTMTCGTVIFSAKVLKDNDKNVTIAFEVSDTGIGISPESIKNIFIAFEQADGSITKSFGGTGLGLSISKRLAELMNGDIRVESELGEGSNFIFQATFLKPKELPVEAEEELLQGTDFVYNNEAIKILVVDDVPLNRTIVKKMLSNELVEIDEAADGEEALEKFLSSPLNHYNIILMDIHMPKKNGYEATQVIRSSKRLDGRKVSIIAMTASAFSEDVIAARQSGMDDHMSKPINMKSLILMVNNYRKKK